MQPEKNNDLAAFVRVKVAEQDISVAWQCTKIVAKGWETTSKHASTKPLIGIVYSGLRRFQIRRFPYDISFDVIDETVVAGFRSDSAIQCENLATRDQSLALRYLGTLPDETMSRLDDCRRSSLGLA